MRLINFCRLLGLVLCGNAVTVYFVSHSFRLAVVTTLGCSLLLQLGYFASVLFLIWRSSCAGKAGQGAGLFDRSQEVRYQSRDDDAHRNETQDVQQRNQTLGISLLLP
ncbi:MULTISPECIES: exopolysaccharide production repressor protein [Mesorhizobium]|uniref:Exopolysaccharide repressor protein n=2 Tax=Mesorhizobium TaxID=68287 RepID=A0A1A5QL21_RHILI|nr:MULTISPECIES: exopolysaccharide production repressor protein [Mesorhizobium]OBP78266.1 exopolysaccharide repressor protein [Mesorhizobium loti]OBP80064.1 exopolysaccharide repressor protein [Mesorhizobium loti]OBQ59123.1 exopolysaccharide repressor protein [Mesorhizobium loti]OBQ68099.1 exopolysaccharide repressor protein [Mesorhizobium loti]QKC73290.1 exopolysaccharide repressor protein [Mesorhizobium loti]